MNVARPNSERTSTFSTAAADYCPVIQNTFMF